MSTINSTPAITSAALPLATAASPKTQPAANPSGGDAVTVSLSAPAQAALAGQNTSSGISTSNKSSSSTAGNQAPVAPQAATVSTAQLVAEARQKVVPKVGISGASDVVDKNGNISQAALTKEIAEQAQKAAQ